MSIAGHSPRPCPACGAPTHERVWRQDFARIEGVSILDGYDVVACRSCGMTFADGIPTQPVFDRYYREASKYEFHQRGGAESAHDAARLAITADAIASRVTDRGVRILDVGCATGRLLAELRSRGFTDLRGIDPSPACVAAARDRYGVQADVATIAQLGDADGRFDLIILVGVLEHLVDLDLALAQLRSRLAPRGMIYVEVPDVAGFPDWPNAPFQEFSVEHVNFFSSASLKRALGARGFSAEWVERNAREQSSGVTVANIAALFRNGARTDVVPGVDYDSRAAVERYVARCATDERELHMRIDVIVAAGEPIIVWGTGTLTLRLLATSALARATIVAFVDSNARYQGHALCGAAVLAPWDIGSRSEPVVIVSRGFAQEIRDQIETELGPGRRVIAL